MITKKAFVLFSLFGICALAQEAVATPSLSVTTSEKGTAISFLVQSSDNSSACNYTLHGSPKRKALMRATLPTGTLLHEWQSQENVPHEITFAATSLSRIRQKATTKQEMFFRVSRTCGSTVTRSPLRKRRFPTIKNKALGVTPAAFISELKEKLPFSEILIEEVFSQLTFNFPVDIRNAGDGTNRLFVVQQGGLIHVLNGIEEPSTTTAATFLDLTEKTTLISERGLLSVAFHPEFATNGFFFVHYNDLDGDTVIARYEVQDENPDQADPSSEKIILRVEQPSNIHNGGSILFGPDGHLYITLGDGGTQLDPGGNGQNRATLLGSILRIDVDTDDQTPYAIPVDNPFVGNGNGYREEIFAYGLRNPWRASFDGGTLWVGDVGQSSFEEINKVSSGENYGWVIMEGESCVVENCDTTGLTLPYFTYPRSLGSSVTGGYVYRGEDIFTQFGNYIFGDFISGRVMLLPGEATESPTVQVLADTEHLISTFGTDEAGEIYFAAYGTGKIFRITRRR